MKLISGSLFPKLNNFQIFSKEIVHTNFLHLIRSAWPIGRSAQVRFIGNGSRRGRVSDRLSSQWPGNGNAAGQSPAASFSDCYRSLGRDAYGVSAA
ncbi:hypothetical protein [Mesorhizobium kowhaii]|uniref:hypothetical protein n=1 Tax=Mesorhizobium kowhaii TaxID=1300272 RepID=UPI0011B81280|nr:hypothetical protein [Mesorhizobium kowhaii]